MENKKRVLLGMSGGVDSSVSAILLQKQGYEVIGCTMKLFDNDICDKCSGNLPEEDAKKVCDKLKIEHHVVDFKKEFKEHVIDNFVNTYVEGKTPNPCVECNRFLKFGAMYEMAKKLGAQYIATGHYARVKYSEKYGRYVIAKSSADKKDQSYVLYGISKDAIEHIVFPLENFKDKEEIRKIASENGLEIAKKPDSQEICFITDNNYMRFLNDHMSKSQKDDVQKKGNIVDVKGKIRGYHNGVIKYTIGQRKGLGIQNPTPLFVIKLDKKNNQVVVGEKEDTYSSVAYIKDVNLQLFDKLEEKVKCKAKIRYSAKEQNATIYPPENGIYKIEFEEPQMAITPGQSMVLYIDDILLGGGKII